MDIEYNEKELFLYWLDKINEIADRKIGVRKYHKQDLYRDMEDIKDITRNFKNFIMERYKT